jgi:hypothetical protein
MLTWIFGRLVFDGFWIIWGDFVDALNTHTDTMIHSKIYNRYFHCTCHIYGLKLAQLAQLAQLAELAHLLPFIANPLVGSASIREILMT